MTTNRYRCEHCVVEFTVSFPDEERHFLTGETCFCPRCLEPVGWIGYDQEAPDTAETSWVPGGAYRPEDAPGLEAAKRGLGEGGA